ncbi:hypothetical protein HPP92_004297 [Vanilla planifolia]|uniref:ABC transporter domain-containing protein n=1 Tax=Vanilla planifolia TaxID=51239 RepID=A0A835RMJ7_VANPL|nr:hypothetical protein HPP92_004297 [Vanilla planifolia]
MSAFSSALESSVRFGLRQGLAKGFVIGSNGLTFAIWAFVVWYSSRLVMYHGAKGGTVFAVRTGIIFGGLSLGSSLSNLKYFGEAIAAAERIREIIERKQEIDSESWEGEELESEAEVFKGFSMMVPAGKTVALVGGSGSGKSTAVALRQRFYNPAGGEEAKAEVAKGADWVGEPGARALRDHNKGEHTVWEGRLEELVEAATVANAHGFISQLPQGYDTQIKRLRKEEYD